MESVWFIVAMIVSLALAPFVLISSFVVSSKDLWIPILAALLLGMLLGMTLGGFPYGILAGLIFGLILNLVCVLPIRLILSGRARPLTGSEKDENG